MDTDTVESLCQNAQQAITAGDYQSARESYLQALELKPEASDVHYGLATVCFLLNDLNGAAHHFKEVTRLTPNHAGAFVNLGAVYNRLDRLDEAIVVLRRGIQLDNNRGEGFYNLGVVHRRKGQIDMAIQAYREATRLSPRMADAHYNIGNLYYEKEQYFQAAKSYRQALEVRPNWEKAQRGLEQAEAALVAVERERDAWLNEEIQAPIATARLDLDRVVDPTVHGTALGNVHKATIDSQHYSKKFVKVVEAEIEPAIRELSNYLLYPDISSNALDECVEKIEAAMNDLRSLQDNLHAGIERVHTLGEQLLKS